MRKLRMGLLLASVCLSPVALAKGPAGGQGRPCDAKNRCDGGLTCVADHAGRSTCERVCTASASCPEDQRCVKDGAQSVCRPINDGVGL